MWYEGGDIVIMRFLSQHSDSKLYRLTSKLGFLDIDSNYTDDVNLYKDSLTRVPVLSENTESDMSD